MHYKDFYKYIIGETKRIRHVSDNLKEAIENTLSQVDKLILKAGIIGISTLKHNEQFEFNAIDGHISDTLDNSDFGYVIGSLAIFINSHLDYLKKAENNISLNKMFYFDSTKSFGYFKISDFDKKYHYYPDLSLLYNDIFNIDYPNDIIMNEEKFDINYKPKSSYEDDIIKIIMLMLAGHHNVHDFVDDKNLVNYIIGKLSLTRNAKFILI